jgi:2-dehydro-3-deoxyphosphooctonate aldolase (KDO 8-P synthase)
MNISFEDFEIGNSLPFGLISGPCQLEGLEHARMIAGALAEICQRHSIPFIFKASYDKANRSSILSERGIGMDHGLEVLFKIRDEFGCLTLADVHQADHCAPVAEVCDILQIPAFLCRQTDLLLAAGRTGRAINIKKGQFLAPWDMEHVALKVRTTGNANIMLCERGTSFGYNTLVSDFRALPIMAKYGYPVIFDATHSVQQPGGQGGSSGGQRQFVEDLARAALSVGCAGLFIETHQDPDNAPSDGANMVPLQQMDSLLGRLKQFDMLSKSLYSYNQQNELL